RAFSARAGARVTQRRHFEPLSDSTPRRGDGGICVSRANARATTLRGHHAQGDLGRRDSSCAPHVSGRALRPGETVQSMIVLGLDTSTKRASVAVVDVALGEDAYVVRSAHEAQVTTHSEALLGLIDATLKDAGLKVSDVEGVACGKGPGSF